MLVNLEASKKRKEKKDLKDNVKLQTLLSMTPKEAYDYVQNNTQNLNKAKELIGVMAAAIVHLLHEAE